MTRCPHCGALLTPAPKPKPLDGQMTVDDCIQEAAK